MILLKSLHLLPLWLPILLLMTKQLGVACFLFPTSLKNQLFVVPRCSSGRGDGMQLRDSTTYRPSDIDSSGELLYEVQEEMITKRGQFEEKLMEGNFSILNANSVKVKGANAGGGFGGGAKKGKPSRAALKAQGKEHAKVLRENGVIRIDNVISPDLADELRDYVFSLRETAFEEVKSGKVKSLQRFANVLLRKNRCDLTMPLNENIYKALYSALCESPVGETMAQLLGKDAVLYELSCLMSDPGSDRQVMHPDTPYFENQDAVLYTCFIALQDINLDMGPTWWLPGTHTLKHHEIFKDDQIPAGKEGENAESPKDTLLRTTPAMLGTLPKGCCGIFDSRLLHAGTANKSDKIRALFYFSFKNPKLGYAGNPGSIRPELIDKLVLSKLTKELENFNKGKAYPELEAIAKTLR